MTGSRRRFLKKAAMAGAMPSLSSLFPIGTGGPELVSSRGQPASGRGENVVLALVGDLFLTAEISDRRGPETEWVLDRLRSADLGFANLENGLSTVGSPELGGFRHGPALRGHPRVAAELRRAGVRAVSLANNHTGNFGREALLETMRTLDGVGVAHAGAGRNVEEAFAPTFLSARGLTVAFLSIYSCYYPFAAADVATADLPGLAYSRAYDVLVQVPPAPDPDGGQSPPYRLGLESADSQALLAPLREDVQRMTAAIAGASRRADFTILSVHFHWGRHGRQDVPFQQRVLAHAAVDAGADLVVGHGPHVVRGIEIYRGKPIAYSLGNFLLEPRAVPTPSPKPNRARESVMLKLEVREKRVGGLELLPMVIEDPGLPRFDDGLAGRQTLGRLMGLSAEFGTEIQQEDWLGAIRA